MKTKRTILNEKNDNMNISTEYEVMPNYYTKTILNNCSYP